MKVCIIGSGLSGLCSAYYLKKEATVDEIEVYEASGQVGGTWNYTEKTGLDDYGAPIHTSMYKHLRTNIPKQCMQVKGYIWPDNSPTYLQWENILHYLQNFAEKEELYKYVKFHTEVTEVSRANDKWIVTSKHFLDKSEHKKEFDFIFICTGHFLKPNLPNIKGENLLKGQTIHSHYYRTPEPFKNKKVLLIGIGPSGVDISMDLIGHAEEIYLSHHSKNVTDDSFPPEIVMKPDVKEFKNDVIVFVDDTEVVVDSIIYCTGYEYYFPFLSKSCNLEVSKYRVYPLYQHIVNVNHPSMFFINMVGKISPFISADLQIKYCLNLMKDKFVLPSKEKMLENIQIDVEEKLKLGIKNTDYHMMGYKELQYYKDLSAESGSEKVSEVAVMIHRDGMKTKLLHPQTYRNFEYKIMDDCTYSKQYPGEEPAIIKLGPTEYTECK